MGVMTARKRISATLGSRSLQVAALALLLAACVSIPDPATLKVAAAGVPSFDAPIIGPDDALFIGAGDIAYPGQLSAAAATGAIIDRIPQAIVFTLGAWARNPMDRESEASVACPER
jgi:hypothetical protein